MIMEYLNREYSASTDRESSCSGNETDKKEPMWDIAHRNNFVKLADGTLGKAKKRVIDRRARGMSSNPRIFTSL